jgi:ABC-type glycerol-3-phosphate transport system substrate-binding protein
MTSNDTPLHGKYNDPNASKIAGKVGLGKFPLGPASTRQEVARRSAWFWAIPKAIAPEQKALAKELLTWLGESEEVQLDIWKTTGGIPPITQVQEVLAKEDPLFGQIVVTCSPVSKE